MRAIKFRFFPLSLAQKKKKYRDHR